MKPNIQVWPVIHLSPSLTTTLDNARMAHECGCPGVFLISMSGDDAAIDPAAKFIRAALPDLKIGINMLTETPLDAVKHSVAHEYNATWTDYHWQPEQHLISNLIRSRTAERHQFFAPVAMKGETHDEPYPEDSARLAHSWRFIPMTSGSSTGVTAPFEKIEMLRKAIGPDAPLAMSGVHPPTAGKLVPLTTHWLVATAISKDFYRFDRGRLEFLMAQIELANINE